MPEPPFFLTLTIMPGVGLPDFDREVNMELVMHIDSVGESSLLRTVDGNAFYVRESRAKIRNLMRGIS